ncbi:hypothetical protein ABIG06_007342 [Bradyrhizobium sp. USDA 326]|uniref:PIN domain-containing protein n=1 Tax=unclassified Bradyrhizobium TaxID=2631580 RepID=UPI0035167405
MPSSTRRKPPKVFLDANVVIRAGKPPGKPVMDALSDLVDAGFIRVLVTDLTKIEVAKKHTNNDLEEIGAVGRARFRKLVKRTIDVDLPELSADALRSKIFDRYLKEVEAMFKRLKAATLSVDEVKPSAVFDAYTHGKGVFSREAKKDQFPDGFIFERLRLEAKPNDQLVIVSDDGDFASAVRAEKHLKHLKSVGDLFEMLGLKREEAPDIESFLDRVKDDFVARVNDEVADWGLQVSDVEDAEIDDSTVTNVEIIDMNTYDATQDRGEILVVGRLKMDVQVSFTHPDWDTAVYDSEDKVLIPFDKVSDEKEVELEAEFAMTIAVGDDGKPEAIEHFSFSNDSFIWVPIQESDLDWR